MGNNSGDRMSEAAIRFKKPHRAARNKKQKRTKPRVLDEHITRARRHIQLRLSRSVLYGVNCKNAADELRLSTKMKRQLGPCPNLALSIALEQLVGSGDVVHNGSAFKLKHS